ncbi:MAG: hypothetical protein GMKNLPBB_01867 [Myxococcota bacterium]|nr:hypothetical protein [Myxococcota bacterium]
MKLYVLASPELVEPFLDRPGEALVLDASLREVQEALARYSGLMVETAAVPDAITDFPCLVIGEESFVSREFWESFLNAPAEVSAIAALPDRLLTSWFTPCARYLDLPAEDLRGVRLCRLTSAPPPGLSTESFWGWAAGRLSPCIVDPGEQFEEISQPLRPGLERSERIPDTSRIAVHLRHWVPILLLNLLLPRIARRQWLEERGWWSPHNILGRFSSNPWMRQRAENVLGRGVRIHPTAYVEGSVIGANVKIGAGAMVRGSYIGDNVTVGDFTRLINCVVARDCHTLNDSFFSHCVSYPGATLSNFQMRYVLLGRSVFVTSGVIFYSERHEGTIPVQDRVAVQGEDGKESVSIQSVDTGRRVLGGCIGHGCILGTRAIFDGGCALPNDYMIVMRPEESVTKIPVDIGGGPHAPVIWRNGRLVPLSRVFPDYHPPELE